jgi:hypothetical protein
MTDVPDVSRPHFYDGQALTAADLNAVQDYHRELLWLHQRTLHGSGIASGFAVTGAKGDKSVTVAPGYAIDAQGRSIVLDSPRVLDIPSVVSDSAGKAVPYYLAVSYIDDDQQATTTRVGTCGSSGAVRLDDAPRLAWQSANATGQDIVLCAITIQNCKLTGPVDLSPQRSALPERQPFVYAGQRTPVKGEWGVWRAGDADDAPLLGLRLDVNTSEAGFVNTPRYQATIVGSRQFSKPDNAKATALLDGYVQINAATAMGFELTMSLPRGDDGINTAWLLDSSKILGWPILNSWMVSWLGVES